MTVCEIKKDGAWRLIAIREALAVMEAPILRCIECHGPVRLVSDGHASGTAHFRHVKRHGGCSKVGSAFGGVKLPHPDAVS